MDYVNKTIGYFLGKYSMKVKCECRDLRLNRFNNKYLSNYTISKKKLIDEDPRNIPIDKHREYLKSVSDDFKESFDTPYSKCYVCTLTIKDMFKNIILSEKIKV